MRPMIGLDLIGGQVQASHGMLHLQAQTPDSGPQINFPRPLEGFGARAPQGTDFSTVRGGRGGSVLNQPNNRDRTAAGRQLNAWSPSPAVQHEVLNMPASRGRAQYQGRGQVISTHWAEPPVGGIPTGFPSPLGVISHTVPINGSPGIAPGGVVALGAPKRQGSLPMMTPNNTAANREITNMKKVDSRPRSDGTWRTNGGNRGSDYNNGTLSSSLRNDSGVRSNGSPGSQTNRRSRENGMDRRHSSKPASLPSAGNGMGNVGNNLIQLGGPVTKSSVLSVSGFPESTSMAVVVEAFEKQGKILDFRKDEKGNAFHITFSSVAEAVSTKRKLHRTLLNGRQITVDYTVQRY